MKKYRIKDPSGEWIHTLARTAGKAESNFRYRLTKQPYGMSPADAREWASTGLEEVPE